MTNAEKILDDVVTSAGEMFAHFEVYWVLASEALKEINEREPFAKEISRHSDFFKVTRSAHYKSLFLSLGLLWDEDPKASSVFSYLHAARTELGEDAYSNLSAIASELKFRVKPLIIVRHNVIAHTQSRKTKAQIVKPLGITWNEIALLVNESVAFVELLQKSAKVNYNRIPGHRRLAKSTFGLLFELRGETRPK
jgi:hypothetical protein